MYRHTLKTFSVRLSISCVLNLSFIVSLLLSLFSHCLSVSSFVVLCLFITLPLFLLSFSLSVSFYLFVCVLVLCLTVLCQSVPVFVCYPSLTVSLFVCLSFQMQKEPRRNGFPVVKMMATPLRANGVYWPLSLTSIWAEYLEVAVRGGNCQLTHCPAARRRSWTPISSVADP